MGRELQYTSIDRIISKIYRDTGIESIPEEDLIEWIGEALESISTVSVYEEAVAFIEIKNHKGDLPNGIHSIIQIARNNKWVKKENCNFSPAEIVLDCDCEVKEKISCGCSNTSYFKGDKPFVLDCNGGILDDYEVAYYRPYFDLRYEYHGWTNSKYYQRNYSPMRLSNHTFFNTLVCQEDEQVYTSSCTDEYTVNGDQIITSFEEGSIAVAYYRTRLDSTTGYPLVPDDYSALQAIKYYITWMYMSRMWYTGREGYGDKMQEAEKQWVWYCRQFSNSQMQIYGIDQHENLKNIRYQMLPQNNSYYGFFGKLGRSGPTFNKHN